MYPGTVETFIAGWSSKHLHLNLSREQESAAVAQLRNMSMQMTIDAIRFLSNSLPTSHRMHSSGITFAHFAFVPKVILCSTSSSAVCFYTSSLELVEIQSFSLIRLFDAL